MAVQVRVEVKRLPTLNPLTLMVKLSGRPWWQARYFGGKQLGEWQTASDLTRDPLPRATEWRRSRWEEAPKKGMIGLRLLTPDGRAASLALEGSIDGARFVQFKAGGASFSMGPGGKGKRFTDATVIGAVNDDGRVLCFAWERTAHAFVPLADSGLCVTCGLGQMACGGRDCTLRPWEKLIETVPDPKWPERVNRSRISGNEVIGTFYHLVHWADDLYAMRYRRIGALETSVQQVAV